MSALSPIEFGKYLQRLRTAKNYTIAKLARLSGVSPTHIGGVEKGIRNIPSPSILKKLAPHLYADYTELLAKAGYYDSVDKKNEAQRRQFIQNDLSFILSKDDLHLNNHPFTDDERTKIIAVLKAVFPEKANMLEEEN